MDICEKVAYIKGLAEGLALDESTKEGKVLAAIIDVLGDITGEICEIEDGCDELMEQLDAVDEDLADLEEIFYDEAEDCDCCDDDMYEVECPNCGETVYFDEEIILDGEAECPNCGEVLEFDCDCDCDCDDCGCEDE